MRVLGFVGVNWFNRETDCGSVTRFGLMALIECCEAEDAVRFGEGDILLVMGSVVDQVGVSAPVFTMFGLLMAL